MEREKQQIWYDMDFTICTEDQLPDEVKELIESRKDHSFQFTYSLQRYCYIIIGYGKQNGGGYSIKVDKCSQDQDRIYIETTLLGSEDSLNDVKSYPYIVLKCNKTEKEVVFL